MASSNVIAFRPVGKTIVAQVTPDHLGFKPRQVWNPSPSLEHRVTPYDLPQTIVTGIRGTFESGAKYSPPPFAVVIEGDAGQRTLVVVSAKKGWHRWNEVSFASTTAGVTVEINLEGRSKPAHVVRHAAVHLMAGREGESRHGLLARGLAELYPRILKPRDIPQWWHQPIYCGWGDQVTVSQWLEGVGEEDRALNYCTQGLYERWIRRLEEAQVPIGTIIIDAGWSETGVMEPMTTRWPDQRGFIDQQHAKGRKVLLWIATWLWDGLDEEYCVTIDGQPMTADPSNPRYIKLLRGWIKDLISPDGYDADGFKIDQLAYSPTYHRTRYGPRFGLTREDPNAHEKTIRTHGDLWGVEMLHKLQKTIYDAAKSVKPDCLVTSSTVHPYFDDTMDMVRIHDMGRVAKDIFEAMKARVDLGKAALPGALTDTDDWIHSNYDTWMKYTAGSHVLGVPCIFYAERFMLDWKKEPATKLIPIGDLKKIAQAWRKAYAGAR